MFGFLHMYETYRSRDNASWSGFTFRERETMVDIA